MRYLRAFGAFWYDFLVGDKWELFVGPIVVLAVAWLLVEANIPGGLVVGAFLFAGFLPGGLPSVSGRRRGACLSKRRHGSEAMSLRACFRWTASPPDRMTSRARIRPGMRQEGGAGDGIRTRDISGKEILCQLSYSARGHDQLHQITACAGAMRRRTLSGRSKRLRSIQKSSLDSAVTPHGSARRVSTQPPAEPITPAPWRRPWP